MYFYTLIDILNGCLLFVLGMWVSIRKRVRMIRTSKLREIEKQMPYPDGLNVVIGLDDIFGKKVKVLQQWMEAESENEISQWVDVRIERVEK
jgi:protein associated with RNAse G/E